MTQRLAMLNNGPERHVAARVYSENEERSESDRTSYVLVRRDPIAADMHNISVQLTLGEMAFVEIIGIGGSISGRTWKWGGSRS